MTARAHSRTRRLALVGAGLLALLVLVAVAAPLLAPYAPGARVGTPFAPPSAAHPLGLNDAGHDLLTELVYGARVSLAVGTTAALVATGVGVGLGLLAGYRRGLVDALVMRVVDVTLALPFLPLMIVVGVFLGPGLDTQVLVIALVMWAGVCRELRAQVLSTRELEHVQAARIMGASTWRVLRHHIGPEVAPIVIPQFVLATKTAVLMEAALSFLGLGDPTARSWGTTLFFAHSRSAFLTDAWVWWVLPPGLGITAAVLGFALLGYAAEDRLRPELQALATRPGTRRRRASQASSVPEEVSTHRGAAAAPAPHHGAGRLPDAEAVATVESLQVAYGADAEALLAVDRVSLQVRPGEAVGLVGASGSGKTTLAAAVAGMLPRAARILDGRVVVAGEDLGAAGDAALRRLRGRHVALVPQDAMSALNPVLRVGEQLTEGVRARGRCSRTQARQRAVELLDLVGVGGDRARAYPHELSGGMRQRAVIAMALADEPRLLVADEPTTGLDVVVQDEILSLLDALRARLGLALLVVSHDLPVVLRLADRVAVLQAGQLVELADAATLSHAPTHPYTQRLLAAVPRLRSGSGAEEAAR